MKYLNKKKKGFTLVEMLIVIVIIGILASALLPRLNSARGRANDTARKADLAQIATALVSYQIDVGSFPNTAGPVSLISSNLTAGGMSSIPKDPVADRVFTGLSNSACTAHITALSTNAGQYGYTPIVKNGLSNNGFLLIAGTETIGGSNSIFGTDANPSTAISPNPYCDAAGYIGSIRSNTIRYEHVRTCNSIVRNGTANTFTTSNNCSIMPVGDLLRYVYIF